MRTPTYHAERERHRQAAKKLWIKTNGPIPNDEKGMPYQIHHKDRDWRNNSLDNLQCVSRQEHDAIHHIERVQRAKDATRKFLAGNRYGELNAGKVRTAETRRKIAAARRGVPMLSETKAKIALSVKRTKSTEHSEKLGTIDAAGLTDEELSTILAGNRPYNTLKVWRALPSHKRSDTHEIADQQKDIATSLQINLNEVYRAFVRLTALGLLVKQGRGKFRMRS